MIYLVDLIVGALKGSEGERGHCSAECFVHGMGASVAGAKHYHKEGRSSTGGETIIL